MAHCATQMFAWVELAWDGSSPYKDESNVGSARYGDSRYGDRLGGNDAGAH